jgi:hypothetical protein
MHAAIEIGNRRGRRRNGRYGPQGEERFDGNKREDERHPNGQPFVAILLLAGASSVAWAAQAQPVTGFYIAGSAGVNFRQNQGIQSVNGATLSNTMNLQSQSGAMGVISLRRDFDNGFRTELEGDYHTMATARPISPTVPSRSAAMSRRRAR